MSKAGKRVIRGLKEAVRHANKSRQRAPKKSAHKRVKQPARTPKIIPLPSNVKEMDAFLRSPRMRKIAGEQIDKLGPLAIMFMVSVLAARSSLKNGGKDWPNWLAQVYGEFLEIRRAVEEDAPKFVRA